MKLVIFLLALVALSRAIFRDDTVDWSLSNLGLVSTSAFLGSHLIVGTEQGFLGRLNGKVGIFTVGEDNIVYGCVLQSILFALLPIHRKLEIPFIRCHKPKNLAFHTLKFNLF